MPGQEVSPALGKQPGSRERQGGVSGTPHRDGRRQPTPPEVRWELATVARMTKKLQGKHPDYYNVRLNSNNLVSKSVELLPGGTWQVWRKGRWWSPDKNRPAPDAQEQPQL